MLLEDDEVGICVRFNTPVLCDDLNDIRCCLKERVFYGALQSDRGGRATSTAAVKAQMYDAIAEAREFDIAAMRLEIRPHLFDASKDASLDVVGMQAVQKEHACDEIIIDSFIQCMLSS